MSECGPGNLAGITAGRLDRVWLASALLYNWRLHLESEWQLDDEPFDPYNIPVEDDDEIPVNSFD